MSKAAELAALIGSGQAQGNKNLIINGAMTIDQRHDGSSFTIVNGNSLTGVIADRFRVNETSGAVMTGQRVADAPVGFEYSSKLTVTTADASLGSTEFHRMIQPIEGKNISNLNWGTSNAKTLTLTFYVKSSVTGQYYISVFNNAADRTLLKGYTIDSANTWEKKTITIIGDQTGTWLTTNAVGIHLMWSLGTGSTYQSSTLDAYQAGFYMAKSDQVNIAASVSSTWQLTGVQLEIGDGPGTAFEHEDIGTTLRKCKRYYELLDSDIYPTEYTTASLANYLWTEQKRGDPSITADSNAGGHALNFTHTSGGYFYKASANFDHIGGVRGDAEL